MKKNLFLCVLMAAILMLSVNVFGDIITVGPGGGYNYETIQAAIAAAISGDEIQVAAGEYVEVGQIVIDKDLTIIGAGKDITVIKPAGNLENWIVVEAGNMFYLSYVTLDGEGKSIRCAIRTHGSGAIENCVIKNIAWSTYLGWGMALTWSTPNQNWTVSQNDFMNIERVGILVDGANNQATISGNTFTGDGEGDRVQYGVEVGDSSDAYINGNTIQNYLGVASSDGSTSAGILVTSYFGPTPVAQITGNTIMNNTTAIYAGYFEDDSSIVSASSNTLLNNRYQVRSKIALNFDLEATLVNNTFDKAVVVRENPIVVPLVFSFIQDAIDAASDGNTVEVYQGTYVEHLLIEDVINLKLTTDPDNPATIKYEVADSWSVVDMRAEGTILENFNIIRNNGASGSQAINVRKSNQIVRGTTITGYGQNHGPHAIPGIMFTDGNPNAYDEDIANIVIENNHISGDFAYGIWINSYGTGTSAGSIHNVQIVGNTMEGLYYYWNSQLRAGWAIGMSADITTQITYNDITGQGLYIINIPEPVEGYNVQIHRNRFLGEDRWGVYNMSGVTVNATCNWWDHILGPTHTGNPLGEGNKSSDYVIYQPWCYNYELDCGEVPLPVELSSFNAVVTANLYVQLLWTAETETNMLGYNVFRSEDEEVSNALKFNDVLIGASNGSVAANYSYTDMDVVPGMTYYYWLEINDLDLTTQFYGPISVLVNLEEEGPEIPSIPLETKLIGAYPNPFNPGTSIGFSLAEPSRVTITIYNSKGQLIRTLINSQEFAEGRNHSVYFDGKNQQGKDIASGIYFYIMQTNTDHSEVKKMLLLK